MIYFVKRVERVAKNNRWSQIKILAEDKRSLLSVVTGETVFRRIEQMGNIAFTN